jgi:hypothetical protein
MESILDSIKQLLGIGVDDVNFDGELIIDINGALNILNQLGVGPSTGFMIRDRSQIWKDFVGARSDLELIKSATHLRVKLVFDPPQNSFLVASIKELIKEYDWQIAAQLTPPIIPEVVPVVE